MDRLSGFPFMGWSIVYYILLFLVYRYLVYDYVTGVLDRQLLGFSDTVALTAVFFSYLILCAIPSFLWSRKSQYHPLWRGIESFVCYLLVALIMGAIFAAVDEGTWSAFSGISACGDAWARIGSVAVLLALFIGASWWGGKSAAERRRKTRSRRRKKNMRTES